MGSRFFRWFSKRLQKRTNRTESTNIAEINEFPVSPHETESVMHLDFQETVKSEAMEGQENQQELHLDHSGYTSTCKLVSAGDSSRTIKPGIACYEADIKSEEICLTGESSQSILHIEVSENAQALTTNSETSNTLNIHACGAYENYVCSGLCTSSDLFPAEISVYSGLTAGEIALIENDVEIHLNRICPATYYDFCLITCDADYEEAAIFRSEFCREYNLIGCMLFDDDIAHLGEDIFDQYEAMMKRSTKVFFYHTENYKKDNVHCRVQNGAVYQQLWERMCKDKDKCVPIFPNGSHKLGLALSGISGLDPTLPDHMRRRVLATFTNMIRKVRVLKEAEAKRKRYALYKELCEYVAQYYKETKDSVIRQGKDLSMRTQLPLSEEGTRQELEIYPSDSEVPHLKQMLTSLSVEEEAKNIIHKLVSESCKNSFPYDHTHNLDTQPSQSNSSNGVNISSSSNIHVGPRIELNVHVNRTEERYCHLNNESDDDTLETKNGD